MPHQQENKLIGYLDVTYNPSNFRTNILQIIKLENFLLDEESTSGLNFCNVPLYFVFYVFF